MKDLSQINLIIGSTDFLIDREIDLVVNKVKQKQKEIEKKHLIAKNEDAFSQLIDYLSPNLFGNQSIVIIDEINVAEDKLDDKLVQFIKNIDSQDIGNNFVIIVHRGGAGGTGIVKALQKKKINEIQCEVIKAPNQILDFMRSEFKRNKRQINEDALIALRDAVGENLEELHSAISQLCFDVTEENITIESVKKYYQGDRKSTRLNSSHSQQSRMPSSA